MKLILCIFEELSDLKINFHKSEIFCFNQAKEVRMSIKSFLVANSLPFGYLGIPIHFRKLKNGEWKPIKDKFEKK
jgi:hypothetical protein